MCSRDDAIALRRSVQVLRRRSTKPNGFWFRIFQRILLDTAERIEREQA